MFTLGQTTFDNTVGNKEGEHRRFGQSDNVRKENKVISKHVCSHTMFAEALACQHVLLHHGGAETASGGREVNMAQNVIVIRGEGI